VKTTLGGSKRRSAKAAPRIVAGGGLPERGREIQDAIARRAYEIFEQRGREHGRHEDDWLRAEAELLQPAALEIEDTGLSLAVRAEVRGFTPGEIELGIEPHRVSVFAARASASVKRKGAIAQAGSCTARIFRTAELPCEVDALGSAVTVRDGRLEVILPKATAREVRRAG
jgi:HSP20 family molecular chaperone IbpA